MHSEAKSLRPTACAREGIYFSERAHQCLLVETRGRSCAEDPSELIASA